MSRATDNVSLRRISDEIWMEFYQPGLRVRFELNQDDIDALAKLAVQMAQELRTHLASKTNAHANPE